MIERTPQDVFLEALWPTATSAPRQPGLKQTRRDLLPTPVTEDRTLERAQAAERLAKAASEQSGSDDFLMRPQ